MSSEQEILDLDSYEEVPTVEEQNQEEDKQVQEPQKFFYLAAVTLLYERQRTLKSRQVNVLIEIDAPCITQAVLNQIQIAAISRIKNELSVNQKDIKDIIVTNISPLGVTTHSSFYAPDPNLIAHTEEPKEGEIILDQKAPH